MSPTPSRTNRNLAFVALLVGVLALIAGQPLHSNRVSVDPAALAYKIEHELDHVTPEELENWIQNRKSGFQIIDLRSESEFAMYHIPGAERLDLTSVMGAPLDKNTDIVLYSEGGVHSAQAMFLLWAKGYTKVFMLKGGIEAWNADILHRSMAPSSPSDSLSTQKPLQHPKSLNEEEKFRNEC